MFPSYKPKEQIQLDPKLGSPEDGDISQEGSSEIVPSEAAASSIEDPSSTFRLNNQDVDVKARMEEIKTQEGTGAEYVELGAESLLNTSSVDQEKVEVGEGYSTQGTQNTSSGVSARSSMYGYTPSPSISSQSVELEEKGEVEDAKTWIATLLNRLTSMVGA